MRPNGVVFLLPDSDDAFGVVEGIELVHAEAFVTDFPVEGFHEAFFPGLSGRDEDSFCFTSPLGNSVTDGLWPVIDAQCPRGASLDGQQAELFGEVLPGNRVVDDSAQAFPGVFVNHGENLDGFAGHGRIELEVDRPHVVCFLRSDAWHC